MGLFFSRPATDGSEPVNSSLSQETHNQQVRVEFRQASSDDVLIVKYMNAEDLPESFALKTQLDLGIGVWSVERAEPEHASEFRVSGSLVLWLERVESRPEVPVEDELLFAPAATHPLPTLDQGAELTDDMLFLYGEDWRQNELVSTAHRTKVEGEFSKLSVAFPGQTRQLTALGDLLAGVTRGPAELAAHLDAELFDGVALCLDDGDVAVAGGFAFETEAGTVFYGCVDARGVMCCLGVHVWDDTRSLMADLALLGDLLGADDYLFISWESQSSALLSECQRVQFG